MSAFRLVDQVHIEPVEVAPLCTHVQSKPALGPSTVKSWTVAASDPPPGATAFQWSVSRNVSENRISPE
jgi:hypothetical protein